MSIGSVRWLGELLLKPCDHIMHVPLFVAAMSWFFCSSGDHCKLTSWESTSLASDGGSIACCCIPHATISHFRTSSVPGNRPVNTYLARQSGLLLPMIYLECRWIDYADGDLLRSLIAHNHSDEVAAWIPSYKRTLCKAFNFHPSDVFRRQSHRLVELTCFDYSRATLVFTVSIRTC